MELVEREILWFHSIGRAAQECRELAHLSDIVALGVFAELADLYVFEHPPPQRADGRTITGGRSSVNSAATFGKEQSFTSAQEQSVAPGTAHSNSPRLKQRLCSAPSTPKTVSLLSVAWYVWRMAIACR
jgi:hypothetical protein